MITCFIGTVGSGKTCSAVRSCYEYYKMGLRVYSNIHLSFPYTPLTDAVIDEYFHNKQGRKSMFQDAVLFIDEVHQYIDSRSGMRKKNKKRTYFMLQTRKLNLRLITTTQRFHQVDVRFRDIVDLIVICENLTVHDSLVHEGIDIYLRNRQIVPGDYALDIPDKNVADFMFKANPYFSLYDTKEIIDMDTDLEESET